MPYEPWYIIRPEDDEEPIPETWTVEKHLMNAMQNVRDAHRHLDTALYKQRRESGQ